LKNNYYPLLLIIPLKVYFFTMDATYIRYRHWIYSPQSQHYKSPTCTNANKMKWKTNIVSNL